VTGIDQIKRGEGTNPKVQKVLFRGSGEGVEGVFNLNFQRLGKRINQQPKEGEGERELGDLIHIQKNSTQSLLPARTWGQKCHSGVQAPLLVGGPENARGN